MKQKDKPDARTAAARISANRKKKPAPSGAGAAGAAGSSLLKKNEFTLIIAGALVVTLVVFFLFFRSSDSQTRAVPSVSRDTLSGEMQERLASMEAAIENMQAKLSFAAGEGSDADLNATLARLQQQISRLEVAAQVKFDSLTERMGNLEKKLSAVSKQAAAPEPEKNEPRKNAPVVKKSTTVQDKKAAKVFHTVKKGETLWSISRKYNTTVAALRKINNLSPDADIYPGTDIAVR
jgi:LysM repeat protein